MIQCLFRGDRIPHLFIVEFLMLLGIDNRGKRRRHNHPLHRRRILFDGSKDSGGTLDRGIEEVLHGILNIEVERGSRVKDIVEWRV